MLTLHKRVAPFVTFFIILAFIFFASTTNAVTLETKTELNDPTVALTFTNFAQSGPKTFKLRITPPTHDSNPELTTEAIESLDWSALVKPLTHYVNGTVTTISMSTNNPVPGGNPDLIFTWIVSIPSTTSSIKSTFSLFFQTTVLVEVYESGTATYSWRPRFAFTPSPPFSSRLHSIFPSYTYFANTGSGIDSAAVLLLSRLPGLKLNDDEDYCLYIKVSTNDDAGSHVESIAPSITYPTSSVLSNLVCYSRTSSAPTFPITLTVNLSLSDIAQGITNPPKITIFELQKDKLNTSTPDANFLIENPLETVLPTKIVENEIPQAAYLDVLSYTNMGRMYQGSDSVWFKIRFQYRARNNLEYLYVLPHRSAQHESHIYFCEFESATVNAAIDPVDHGRYTMSITTPSDELDRDVVILCYAAVSPLFRLKFINPQQGSPDWNTVSYTPLPTDFAIGRGEEGFVNSAPIPSFSSLVTGNHPLPTAQAGVAVMDPSIIFIDQGVFQRVDFDVKLPGYTWNVGVEFEIPADSLPASLVSTQRLPVTTFVSKVARWEADPTSTTSSSGRVPFEGRACSTSTSNSGSILVLCKSALPQHSLDLSIGIVFFAKITSTPQVFPVSYTVHKYHHLTQDVVVAKRQIDVSFASGDNYPSAFGLPLGGDPNTVKHIMLPLTKVNPGTNPSNSAIPTIAFGSIWVKFNGAYFASTQDTITVYCQDNKGQDSQISPSLSAGVLEVDIAMIPFSSTSSYYCTITYTMKPSTNDPAMPQVVSTFITPWFKMTQNFCLQGTVDDNTGETQYIQSCVNGICTDQGCNCQLAFYGPDCTHMFPTITFENTVWALDGSITPLAYAVPPGFDLVLVATDSNDEFVGNFDSNTPAVAWSLDQIVGTLFPTLQKDHPTFSEVVGFMLRMRLTADHFAKWDLQFFTFTFQNSCGFRGVHCFPGAVACTAEAGTWDCDCHDDYFGEHCALPRLSPELVALGQPYLFFKADNMQINPNHKIVLSILSAPSISLEYVPAQNGFSLSNLWDTSLAGSIDPTTQPYNNNLLVRLWLQNLGSGVTVAEEDVSIRFVDRCVKSACFAAGTLSCSEFGCICKSGFQGTKCDQTTASAPIYSASTRTMTIQWTLPPPKTKTDFFRIALVPDALSDANDPYVFDPDQVIWTTASYTVSNVFVSSTTPTTNVRDAFWIPDFIGEAHVNIPPLPNMNTIAIFLISQDDISSPLFSFRYNNPILSICDDGEFGAECGGDTCNLYYSTGCAPNPSTAIGSCPELECPPSMTVDLSTCSCQCNSATCLANTRVAMLYFNDAPLNTDFESRFNSYVSRTMKTELALSLGLNPLPPPHPSTTTSPANRLRGYIINQNDVLNNSPPVGFEHLHLIPITYNSLKFTSLLAYITITPFDSTVSAQSRWTVLQNRLQLALHTHNIFSTTNNRILYGLTQPSTSAQSLPNALLLQLTTPSKFAVQCVNPTDQSTTPTCPSVSAIYSPFWGPCDQNKRSLTVRCVDFAGQLHQDPTICAAPFYPRYPKQSSITGCQTPVNYGEADIANFSFTSNFPIQTGTDSVLFTWSYGSQINPANPTYTVDIFVRKIISPFVLNELEAENYHIDHDDDDDDDDEYQENAEMTIQQSLSAGYRVLLGTYPAKDQLAFVQIPATLSPDSETNFEAKFIIRVTQQANRAQSTMESSSAIIRPKNSCDACSLKQHCSKGQCVCDVGLKFDAHGKCVPMCTDLCKNGTTCLETGICDCGQSFSGSYCEIDKSCVAENRQLCKNRGSVLFNSSTNTCGSECTCFSTNHWIFDPTPAEGVTTAPAKNSNCNKCNLLDFANELCDPVGTSSTRTTTLGCVKCECVYGFSGDRCQFRVAYGTISFTPPSSGPFMTQAVPLQASTTTTVTGTPLDLDADTTAVLVRDMALSLNVPVDSLTLKQAIQIAPLSANMNIVQLSGTRNAITFEMRQTQDANMSNLYDLWGDVEENFDARPIGQTEAREVGTPAGAEPAFDPQCDTTVTGNNCPTGSNPLVADKPVEDTEPLIPEVDTGSSSVGAGTIVAIVVPIIVAALVILAAIIVVSCMRKHQKGCFAPKKSHNEHLELESYTAEASAATTTQSQKSNSNKSNSKPTAFSSGTTTSVDLLDCELDTDEDKLPAGWKKMKHAATGQVMYINDEKMVSQKHHPSTVESAADW